MLEALLKTNEEENKTQLATINQLKATIAEQNMTIDYLTSDQATQIANQIIRNQLLNQVIKVYDQQITEIKKLEKIRNLLIFRIRFLENIQFSRVLIIHLFDELSKITPPGVYLTRIKGKNNVISISGYTQSSVFISREMTRRTFRLEESLGE